jgi:hypothetical protein
MFPLTQQPQQQNTFQQSPLQQGLGQAAGSTVANIAGTFNANIPRNLNTLGAIPNQQSSGIDFGAYRPSQTGGLSFPPINAKQSTNAAIPTAQPQNNAVSNPKDYNQYTISQTPTPNGGQVTTNGNGIVQGYSNAPQFKIDTSNIGSNALGSTAGINDVNSKYQGLTDIVNGVAQAQGYNPQYLQALQQQYAAQQQGAGLNLNQAQYGVNAAALNSNFYTGNNLPGDTLNYAQGATAKAQAQNTLAQSQNTLAQGVNAIQQLGANQALNTAQLARTGQIAAAQTQLQSPAALAAINSINSVNTLGNAYPGAGILPTDSIEEARQKAAQSPAYQAGFQGTYSTPGGGIGIYNKLNSNALQQNADGTIQLVSGAAASLGTAQSSSLNQAMQTYNQLAPAFKAANDDFTNLKGYMSAGNINQSDVPIINQIQNAVGAKLLAPGAIAGFKASLASLRTNYGNLLGSRGETPTQAGQDAITLIPDNLKPSDMAQVEQQLNVNGANILNATGQQISSITSQLGGQFAPPVTPGGTNGGVNANSWAGI